MPHHQNVQELSATFRGNLVTPRDSGYDDVRKLYNGMIEKRPRFIAQCTDVADVIDAVSFGRDNDLLIALRGGGHNGGGLGSCDDGLMIDLAPMKGVRVDPDKRTVRVEPGCTQGDVDHATHPFGLAVPAGIVSSTGISGLTLGGGHGYLTRQCGLTIDNLIEADVVLADGSFVTASATQSEDLFWALRGGGGNFGVVTSFLFRAHLVRTVYAGPILWDFAHAREIMQWYRAFLPSAPEELCTFLGLKKIPASDAFPRDLWGKVICALVSSYNGDAESGAKAMKPARESLPRPLVDAMGPMPFPALQSMFDPLLPKGLQWYWKGDFVKDLPDEAIDAYLAHASQMPGELSLVHLYPIDGAVHRVAPDETAWRFRDATWSMVIAGIDSDPRKARELVEWGRGYWDAVHPFAAGAAYVNFMMDDEGQDRIRATYGANYERLAAIKARYDPANLFRVNQNIPAASQPRTKQ